MVKVTIKKLAELLNRSPGYTRVLLHREGVLLTNFEGIVEIIQKYRRRAIRRKNQKTVYENCELEFERARNLFDAMFCKKYFDEIKESFNGKCQECGSDESIALHHIDFNHLNNKRENLSVLCLRCHSKIHFTSNKNYKLNGYKVQLLTVPLAAQYTSRSVQTIYNWMREGHISVYYAHDDTPLVSHRELLEITKPDVYTVI